MSANGGKFLTVILAVGVSWYTGVRFWQPLVIEQLKKDGNLRDDIYIADTSYQPTSWQDLREKVEETLHPKPEDMKNNSTSSPRPTSGDKKPE